MTPYQLRERVEAYEEERDHEMSSIKLVSWFAAALQRGKRLPSLRTFLNDGRQVPAAELRRLRRESADRDAAWPSVVRDGRAIR